jgi:hypothetical protein
VANLFDRLGKERPQPAKKTIERRPRNAGFVAQGEKDAKIKSFLLDLLAKRPVLATAIQKRGATQGFSKKQLWRAKRLLGIISFRKEGYGFEGRWYWARAQHDPNTIKPGLRFTRRLRNLTRSLGYRLQPIGRKGGKKPSVAS